MSLIDQLRPPSKPKGRKVQAEPGRELIEVSHRYLESLEDDPKLKVVK